MCGCRAKESLKNLNLETSGSDKAETSHVQGTGAVTDSPDMSKGSKRMRESVMNRIDPAVDKNDVIQTEEVPKKAPGKKKVNKGKEKVHESVARGETDDEKIRHQTLKLKTSPRKIIEVLQSLNEEQMNDVIDMGFGELRNFGIAEVPGKLAYDLVKGFGEVDCTIQLENQRLTIYPEDVYLTLGLPIGGTLINHVDRQKKKPFFEEVAQRIGKNVELKNWRLFMWIGFSTKNFWRHAFSRHFFGWTSEKLRQREKMELESGDTIGRGSLVDRGDPDKLPHPSTILVFEEEEMEEKDQWEIAIEGFAEASEDAVRGLQNLLRSMNDVTNLIQSFEAMKIAGSTAYNMIGIIPEVEVDEEETVASLKTALAKDNFNVPELVEVVQSMFKVTAQLTQLAEEGPPFDIHPSFLPKNVS
ncbi:hypothetical protein SASPL_154327 [Salvia splendens]|uniref:Uncharacterized protein n=1 Tax=Salvia splendens TaxID=180675 RepID=A0A8X8VZV1_SALSN|nr:hypothetical protein SASPL_154327 [Salvia splendens]